MGKFESNALVKNTGNTNVYNAQVYFDLLNREKHRGSLVWQDWWNPVLELNPDLIAHIFDSKKDDERIIIKKIINGMDHAGYLRTYHLNTFKDVFGENIEIWSSDQKTLQLKTSFRFKTLKEICESKAGKILIRDGFGVYLQDMVFDGLIRFSRDVDSSETIQEIQDRHSRMCESIDNLANKNHSSRSMLIKMAYKMHCKAVDYANCFINAEHIEKCAEQYYGWFDINKHFGVDLTQEYLPPYEFVPVSFKI